MKNSQEVSDIGRFIRARREATDASTYKEIPARRRHVPHLTQSDLADLVDVSTVVISQIELGTYPNLSLTVLEKIAESLRFTPQQQVYLFGLFKERPQRQFAPEPEPAWLRISIDQIAHPVVVVNPMLEVVVMNNKARNLLGAINPETNSERSSFISIFQQPFAKQLLSNWDYYTASMVSGIKVTYAMLPGWRAYIDERSQFLAENDAYFRELWLQDDPLVPPTLDKFFNHPKVGTLHLKQILTDIIEIPGLTKVEFLPSDDITRTRLGQL